MKNTLFYSPTNSREEDDCCFVIYNKKVTIYLFPTGDHCEYNNLTVYDIKFEVGTKILTY